MEVGKPVGEVVYDSVMTTLWHSDWVEGYIEVVGLAWMSVLNSVEFPITSTTPSSNDLIDSAKRFTYQTTDEHGTSKH